MARLVNSKWIELKAISSRTYVFKRGFSGFCSGSRFRYSIDPSLIVPEIHEGSLMVLFNQHLITESAFYLVYPKNHNVSLAMKAFKQ